MINQLINTGHCSQWTMVEIAKKRKHTVVPEQRPRVPWDLLCSLDHHLDDVVEVPKEDSKKRLVMIKKSIES